MKTINTIKTTLVLCLMCISMLVQAQDSEERTLGKFQSIRVSEGIEVDAKKGTENKIEIFASRISLDRVLTDVKGNRLSIHLDGNNHRKVDVRAVLTYTDEFESITVNTGAELLIKSVVKVDDLKITTSTSGMVELEVEADFIDVSATTSGRVELIGGAEDVEFTASTGGSIYAYQLDAKTGYARANTGADVRLSVDDNLSASAGTGGTVSYKGRPKTRVRTNTGGSVRRG